jgi:hypothetical protein
MINYWADVDSNGGVQAHELYLPGGGRAYRPVRSLDDTHSRLPNWQHRIARAIPNPLPTPSDLIAGQEEKSAVLARPV